MRRVRNIMIEVGVVEKIREKGKKRKKKESERKKEKDCERERK